MRIQRIGTFVKQQDAVDEMIEVFGGDVLRGERKFYDSFSRITSETVHYKP